MKIPKRLGEDDLPHFPVEAVTWRYPSELAYLRKRFDYHRTRLALHKRRYQWLFPVIVLPIVLAALLAVLLLPAVLSRVMLRDTLIVNQWLTLYMVYTASLMITCLIIWPNLWLRRLHRQMIKGRVSGTRTAELVLLLWSLVSASAIAWGGMALISARPDALAAPVAVGLIAGVSGPALFLGLMLLMVLLVVPVRWWERASARTTYPDALVAMASARILANPLERTSNSTRRVRQRIHVLAYDEVARVLETDLPKLLRTRAPEANAWIRSVGREFAAAQRLSMRSVHFTDDRTRKEALESVAAIFVASVTSQWYLAPRAIPTAADHHRRVRARLAAFLRQTPVALMPLAGVAALRATGVVGSVPDSVMLLAYGWTIVALLGALDPNFSSRMAVFKDAMGTIGVPGK